MICNICNGMRNIKTVYGGVVSCHHCNGTGYVVMDDDKEKAVGEIRDDFLEAKINKLDEYLTAHKDQFVELCSETDSIMDKLDSLMLRVECLEKKLSDKSLDRISEEMAELFKDKETDLEFVTPEEAERINKEVKEELSKKRGRPKKIDSTDIAETII